MIGAHELTIAADLTYRQVDFWTRAGYLTATPVDPAFRRSGYPRTYPDDQLDIAVQMSRLTKAGFPPKTAHALTLQLLEHGRADLGTFHLVPVHEASLTAPPLPDVVRRLTPTGDTAA